MLQRQAEVHFSLSFASPALLSGQLFTSGSILFTSCYSPPAAEPAAAAGFLDVLPHKVKILLYSQVWTYSKQSQGLFLSRFRFLMLVHEWMNEQIWAGKVTYLCRHQLAQDVANLSRAIKISCMLTHQGTSRIFLMTRGKKQQKNQAWEIATIHCFREISKKRRADIGGGGGECTDTHTHTQ